MEKNRLEAFSDGVLAIILTIMVLDLKVPKEHSFEALANAWPIFGAYALSYLNVFLIWLNHHDIFSALPSVNRRIMLANGALLFVVSLIPFATAFASESHWTESVPVLIYGVVMSAVSVALMNLRRACGLIQTDPTLAKTNQSEIRISKLMAVTFMLGAAAGWVIPRSALFLYALIPLLRRVRAA